MEQTSSVSAQLELNVSRFLASKIGISKLAYNSPLMPSSGHKRHKFQ